MSPLFESILEARGLTGEAREHFLSPDYGQRHDPFLLPDMQKAVDYLVEVHGNKDRIVIYGDYDIDGLTATTVLLDALESFGFVDVDAYIPNRFVEGYGLTIDAVEKIAQMGAKLIITVDCGSLSEKEIVRANELGMKVIVTDHHNVAPQQPPAVAVINPKRLLADFPDEYKDYLLRSNSAKRDGLYPFLDLPGVGVAFKLVQALQTRLNGLAADQEKWLLDLVALGTVCDVVTLVDENRMHVYWGLKVLAKTRRQGLKALMAVAAVEPEKVNARHLGFGLGPRMNAAGRLETAQYALDMLRASDGIEALEQAQRLDELNIVRRSDQDKIYKAAILQAEHYMSDPVLVVSHADWSHGVIGIVAAKLLEKYKKPAYVLQELGEESKGSARSFGDFSAADAIRAADDIITKGGGHKLAAGVTLPTKNISLFRQRVNEYYRTRKLFNQEALLLPKEDVTLSGFYEVSEALLDELALLEPFGNGNPEPVLKVNQLLVVNQRRMGADAQHVKLELRDSAGQQLSLIAFGAPESFFAEPGEYVTAWFQPIVNEWRGRRSIEGRLLHVERV
jgi:single-stranded-DNA-specific exonuclease